MNTGPQVTFTSDFFKPIAGEEEHTNPGCYGKAWATWLADRLRERGVSVEGVIPEDFGWVVMISRKPFLLWLACSNTDGSITEWTVYSVAELSLLQRLFNRVDPAPEIERLRSHLAELVPSIPCVTNVVWECMHKTQSDQRQIGFVPLFCLAPSRDQSWQVTLVC